MVAAGMAASPPFPQCRRYARRASGPSRGSLKKLVLQAKAGKARKRALLLIAKDDIDLGAGAGSDDDPTVHGGWLRVFSSSVDGAFDDTYPLAVGKWKPIRKSKPEKGYRYGKGDPIKSILVKGGKRIRIVGKGAGLGHSLGLDPNPVLVELAIGDRRFCMEFGGTTNHRADKKFIARNTRRPSGCPPRATTSTTIPAQGCDASPAYPLGDWDGTCTGDGAVPCTAALSYTMPTEGTWPATTSNGQFTASSLLARGASVTLTLTATGGYVAENQMTVSVNGCCMEGPWSDNQGASGTLSRCWMGGQIGP